MLGCQTIGIQQYGCLAGLTELIVNPNLLELAVDLAHQHISHCIAQTTDNTVFLHCNYIAGLLRIACDALGIDGLNGVNINHGDFNALYGVYTTLSHT